MKDYTGKTDVSPLWCANDAPHGPHDAENEFGSRNYCTGRPKKAESTKGHTMSKVIHEVDRWGGGRYVVESLRDAGDYRWEERTKSNSREAAISYAEKLVRENDHWSARVVDTQEDEA